MVLLGSSRGIVTLEPIWLKMLTSSLAELVDVQLLVPPDEVEVSE